jgi:hypothetical protein
MLASSASLMRGSGMVDEERGRGRGMDGDGRDDG